MVELDLYAVLGVLPDAEDVVITAAYRALAQRYHPDRWKGDPSEAHRRMADIYRAYATLGDKAARAEYDRKRQANSGQASFGDAEDGRKAEAFESALGELEGRCNWLPPFSPTWLTIESVWPASRPRSHSPM